MNEYLITLIQKYLEAQNGEPHVKDSFWASESETNVFDIYHRWLGTPITNPIDAERLMIMKSGKLIEQTYISMLQEIGIVKKTNASINSNVLTTGTAPLVASEQTHFRIERCGVPVSGYLDGIIEEDGKPYALEIKSYYSEIQDKELRAGRPRESYLKQLAIYCDYLDCDKGYLLYINRGTGQVYQFMLERYKNLCKCINVTFDLDADVYKKWARLYKNNIVPKIEPKSEYRYKYPVEQIDFTKLAPSLISKMRNEKKVHGDWQAIYSPYLNLIIQQEGTIRGYTKQELDLIRQKSKGFSTW